MSSHLFAFEHSSWSLVLTSRTMCSVRNRVTMSCILHSKVVTLNTTLKTFTFRYTSHIYFLTNLEHSSIKRCSHFVLMTNFDSKLPQASSRLYANFSIMTRQRLVYIRTLLETSSYLNSTVTICISSFNLSNFI